MDSCSAAAVLVAVVAVNPPHLLKSVAKCVAEGQHKHRHLNTLWAALASRKFEEISSMNFPQWAGQGRP